MLAALLSLLLVFSPLVHADTATSTAQAQIDSSTAQITDLKQQIAQLQTQLDATTKQKQTLQSAVNALALNVKKITTSITLTNAQIAQKDTQISTISGSISTTTTQVSQAQAGIADSLRGLAEQDDDSVLVALLAGETLSSFFDETVTLGVVRDGLENSVDQLTSLKTNLETSKTTAQTQRQQLASLEAGLAQQKQGLTIAEQSQSQLLSETKNQESSYQSLITQKQAQETKFEQDLLNFQSNLNLTVNKGALPPSGSSPLAWPLDSVRITQYFGNTPFATANPQIYSGQGHSGIDIAAEPGTPVHAARGGVVLGTGNTDLTCPNASYGKWVFIQHDDGLSTIYAHLASFAVAKGDTVVTGQVIGYSDTTGYATGPHLHFGVFATSGSEISSFASQGCPGKTYTMPVGDLSAYLNPLSYLPPVP